MNMTMSETLVRQQYVYMAKLAEQAGRYEDMVDYMKELLTVATELTVEERILLSVAYKNVIGSLRAAWRVVSSNEQKEEDRRKDEDVELVKGYKSKVENKLMEVCCGVLKLLEETLIPYASTSESKVFYLKMKGDCHRYLAEFKVDDERKAAVKNTMVAYQAAQDRAVGDLAPTHPTRLSLGLNFSVFYYEIMNASEKACSMAREAFEEAIAELDSYSLGEEYYKDTNLIMLQLLKDNFSLWTSDMELDNYKNSIGIDRAFVTM